MKNKTQTREAFNHTVGKIQGPNGRELFVHLDQPQLSSDGGLLLIASDPWTQRVSEKLSRCLEEKRRTPQHSLREMMTQRVLQIVAGYEDVNDATTLRHDGLLQASIGLKPGGPSVLASQPTLCRLENGVTLRDLIRLFYAQIDLFMESYAGEEVPPMLVLDLDPTACPTYGQQELGFYNGHVGDHCLMPFHLYEGISGRLIATVLRPGKTPTSSEIISLLKRVERRIRQRWPRVSLMLRADSHHTKPQVLDWLESRGIDYATGYAPNAVLERECREPISQARKVYGQRLSAGEQEPEVRRFHSLIYRSRSWSTSRRIVARIAVTPLGVDLRYIVTSFKEAKAKGLYEKVYCGRGVAELYIKEHKLDLGADRLSCHSAKANQFRLFLHGAAYMILHGFRRSILKDTRLANATFAQLRLKLIKIASRLDIGARSLHLHLPWQHPSSDMIGSVMARIAQSRKRAAWLWAT